MINLHPFQLEGVQQIWKFEGRALLADEQGLGKTIQALYWIKKTPKRRPVIIVTPAIMRWTWQAEAALHFNMRTTVLEGNLNGRSRPVLDDIIIINYEILHSWLPALIKSKPKCVIFDEIHYLKNSRAQRTKASKKLTNGIPSVVGLSGTPLTNRPYELWSILSILRPDLFPSKEKYAWRYCRPRYTPWGWVYDGASKIDELHRVLKRECMIRRTKKQVLKELPDKIRRSILFRLDSYEEYHKAEKDFLGWLKGQSPVRAARAKKNQALTKIGYLLRLTAQLKLNWTKKWIDDFFVSNPDKKLVALTMNSFIIDELKLAFPQAVVIDGRVIGRHREEAKRRFQSNKNANLALLNWRVAVGMTLTAAHHAVALDFPWTPGDLMQGEDRIHRIGQKHQVIVHYLVALNTIEERLIKALRKKTGILDAILNGEGSTEDFDIFEELLKEIKYEAKKTKPAN